MEKIGRLKGLLLLVGLGLGVVMVKGEDMELVRAIPKNVSGFLVSRNGQFFVQRVKMDESSSVSSLSNPKPSATIEDDAEESWTETEAADEKDDGPTLVHEKLSPGNFSLTDELQDEDDSDDGTTWQRSRKSWLQRWLAARNRGRGSFSIFGIFESAFGAMTKFLGAMMTEEDEEDVEDASSAVSYKDHQLLRMTPKNPKQVKHLEQLKEDEPDDVKFWTIPAKDKVTDVVVSPTMLNEVKNFLREKKIDYTVLIGDLQKVIKSQNPRMPKERRQDLYSAQGHSLTWKRYHRYKDIMGYLDHLAFKYPQLTEVFSIGKSFEGRPLKIIKVSTGANKNGEPKPAIWIDAGMHAREWISTAVATYILNQLVEKSDNYTRLLDLTDWIVMPVANPDGYEFTHTDDRLWRKTRSVHDNDSADSRQAPGFLHMLTHYTKWLFGSCEGVDPNRNFNIHWGEDKVGGASTDPCHDTYAGPAPFSEPETLAIANYLMKNKKTIRTYLTLHSYSQMLLVPWGFTRSRPVDFDALMNIATKAKKAIAKVHGTEYRVGPAAELLYPTTGSSDDWAKAVAGIKNAFTMELRDRGAYGFLLPASQIMPTARETWAGVRVIARMAASNSNT